jgi:hypothetical protein
MTQHIVESFDERIGFADRQNIRTLKCTRPTDASFNVFVQKRSVECKRIVESSKEWISGFRKSSSPSHAHRVT